MLTISIKNCDTTTITTPDNEDLCNLEAYVTPTNKAEVQHNNNLINTLINAICCLMDTVYNVPTKMSLFGFSGDSHTMTAAQLDALPRPMTEAIRVDIYQNGQLLNDGRIEIADDNTLNFFDDEGNPAMFDDCDIVLEFFFELELTIDC